MRAAASVLAPATLTTLLEVCTVQPLKGNWVRLIVAVAVASFVLVFVEVVTGLTTVVALRVATTIAGCKYAVSKMKEYGSRGRKGSLQ